MKARDGLGILLLSISVLLLAACVRPILSDPGEPVPDCSETQTCAIETPCMMFGIDGTTTCCPGPVAECGFLTPQPTPTPCDPSSTCPTPKPCPLGVLSDCPPCLYVESGESFPCPPPCPPDETMPCYITPAPTPTPCDPSSECPTPPEPCPLGVLSDCPPCLRLDSGESFACPPPCPPDDTWCYGTPWPTPSPCDPTACDPCVVYPDGWSGDGSTGVVCATPCLMVSPDGASTCCPGPAAECYGTPWPTPTPCDVSGGTCPPCLGVEAPYIDGCPPPCSPDLEMPCILAPSASSAR